ncbi:MAG TPA: hypothetical protein H9684_06070 [Firmicutes bacterium]|nr:hypothetical protein [Bacillota bacterium]
MINGTKTGKRLLGAAALLCAAAFLAGSAALGEEGDGGGAADSRPLSPQASVDYTVKKDMEGTAESEQLLDTDRLVCENDRLALYVDEEEFIVKVLDKQGDYLWSSGAAANEAQSMTGTWRRFSRAFLTMDYFNATGASLRSSARYSRETAGLVYTEDGLAATLRFQEPDASVRVYITLTDEGFTVRVPDDEMVFNKEDNRLARLYVMPFLGSAYADSIPGYFFIPDGCGALMRFEEPKTYNSSTLLRVYGADASVQAPAAYRDGLAPTPVKNLLFPVYGAVHGYNQNGFLGTITGGETYAGFEISPAGVKIDFHWMSPVFIYREQYRQSTGSSEGFDVVQQTPNAVNAEVTYTLLSGEDASYAGMANAYREQLAAQGALPGRQEALEHIPLYVQAFMADQAASLFGTSTRVFTTLEDAADWAARLREAGIPNLLLSLHGFEKGGYSGGDAGSYALEGRVGSEKELEALYNTLNVPGSGLLLSKEFSRAYEGQYRRSGFLYAINRVFTSTPDTGNLFSSRYYLDAPTVSRLVDSYAGLPAYKRNAALPGIGGALYSNFKEGREMTRAEMLAATQENLRALREASGLVALEAPSQYALAFADVVYNVDMQHSRYIFETDAVPFAQMVTGGHIRSFAPWLNLGAGGNNAVLRLIDYNVYPAYLLTEASSDEFVNCHTNTVYSSRFDDYLGEIREVYAQVDAVLAQVSGAAAVGRSCPEDGVSVVRYDNGRTVLVNYNGYAVQAEGVTVPAGKAVCIASAG